VEKSAIRPSAIGKKNWLFIGHPDAGQTRAKLDLLAASVGPNLKPAHDAVPMRALTGVAGSDNRAVRRGNGQV